jgi:hypothetical protein
MLLHSPFVYFIDMAQAFGGWFYDVDSFFLRLLSFSCLTISLTATYVYQQTIMEEK